ncbi:MAG: nitrous oxide reductase family maturation protein NosD [Chloroflexota bacterium]
MRRDSGMRWPRWPTWVLALLTAIVSGGALRLSAGAADEVVFVCPTCAETSLADAVASAPAGATIDVRGGVYPGGLVIDKPLVLRGVDHPVIDGGGRGTVVRVVGAEVTIQGFTIRGTGSNHDQEDAAIVFDGGRATVIGNRIEDALFGIYLKQAPGSVIKNNVVLAKPVEIAMRGDSIKVWYCDDVVIEGNQASDGRDIILWYSNRALVRNNAFNRSRYGLHLMFSDRARIEGNSLRANSIGLYIMYGRDPVIIGNNLSDNRGPSGGGLGFKDVDRAVVEGNRFVHNNIGAQVDTSPRERGIENIWRDNVFAFNEIGIGFMPSVSHNTLTGNAFLDNTEHVAIIGRGQLKDMTWAVDGRGNYWSDYAGYDANGDGVGDRPYRSQRLFERLTDQQPELRLFLFSPAAMAVDFAAKAFPEVRPEVKFEDPAPLMSAPVSPYLPPIDATSRASRVMLGILSTLAIIGVLAAIRRLRPATVPARLRVSPMRARGV